MAKMTRNVASGVKRTVPLAESFTDTISLPDLPPVKPSAIALGTIFNQTAELAGSFTTADAADASILD